MRSSASLKFAPRTSRGSVADGSSSGRHSVPGPSTFSGFFSHLFYHLLRKPLQTSTERRAVVYFVGVCIGSLVFDLIRFPKSYFSSNTNFFNTVFVKWGWAWTVLPLLFFVTLTSFVYTAGRKEQMRSHLFRLLVASVFWFSWTHLFRLIEYFYGECSQNHLKNRRICIQQGYRWDGFDISGHTFILIFCNMCIAEEVRIMDDWHRLGMIVDSDENPQMTSLSLAEINRMRFSYRSYTVLIKLIVMLLSLLSILWDFMLVMTILYFHTLPTKALAMMISLFSWFISYKVCYQLKNAYPGPPGKGVIKFLS